MASEHAPLKIGSLIFGSLLKIGGYQIFTYNLLKRLVERGHQVDLYITHEEHKKNLTFYNKLPFAVKPLLIKSNAVFRYAPRILGTHLAYRQFRAQYNVWQIVGAYPAGYVASTLANKVPLVLRTHGDDIQKDRRINYGLRLDPFLEKRIASACHKIHRLVAMNQSMADCYRELSVPENNIVEIPNGVDIDLLKKPVNNTAIRNDLNIPPDQVVILTVGRYHPKKGYDVIPAIARKLKDRDLSFLWLIVGSQTDQLLPKIKKEGVANLVRPIAEIGASQTIGQSDFQLPDQALINIYKSADIFVFPSYIEGFPRVTIEAMAAGLPVVTTDAPGCRDVVAHKKTGLLAKPDDINEMANHIQHLIENPKFTQSLIDNASHQLKQYDWDVVVDQYEEVYRSLQTEI